MLLQIAKENSSYDKLIYIPIEFGIEDDGRSTDVEFQKFIDNKFKELLKGIDYVTVSGSVSNRLRQSLEYIQG